MPCRLTWRPSSPSQFWTQIDHVALGHRWCGSVKNGRSSWSSRLGSDHTLVLILVYLAAATRRSLALHSAFLTIIADCGSNHIFQRGCCHSEGPRNRTNTGRSKKSWIQRQLPCKAPYHMNLRNDGYHRPLMYVGFSRIRHFGGHARWNGLVPET